MKKKLLAALLTALLIVNLLPVAGLAAEPCPDGSHAWNNGVCGTCGEVCPHSSGYYAQKCKKCGVQCDHQEWGGGKFGTAGKCAACGVSCSHPTDSMSVKRVTNCNNGSGKYGVLLCRCGYEMNGIVGAAAEHVFSPDKETCANCNVINTNYCVSHNWINKTETSSECSKCHTYCYHGSKSTVKNPCGSGMSDVTSCSDCRWTASTPVASTHNLPAGATGNVTCPTCGHTVYVAPPHSEHIWDENGECTFENCDESHTHSYAADGVGICTVSGCNARCPHPESQLQIVYKDCVKSDYDHQICGVCKYLYNTAYTKTYTQHDYDTNKKCTHCGADKVVCDECDYSDRTGNCSECGEPHAHNYQLVYPNCVTGGYITDFCAGCGNSKGTTSVAPADHEFVNGVCTVCGQEKPDNCPHDWSKEGVCSECGEVCGHDRHTTNTATCLESGYETVTCKTCKNILSITASDPLGHDWDDGVVTVKPTYTAKGQMTYTCKREGCGETMTVELETMQAPAAPGTDGLDYVPKTGNILVEWLYALIFA